MKMANCTCGGNHGLVPVVVAVENGRTTRWCAVAFNARFDDCPGCKGRRRDKKCPKGCRPCAKHGWHEGRGCPGCSKPSGAGAELAKLLQIGATLAGFAGFGLVILIPLLLALPFIMMLGEWLREHGFERLSWAVIIGPTPVIIVPLLLIAIVVLIAYTVAGLFSLGNRR